MPWTEEHLQWLHDTGEEIVTACGKTAPVLEFRYDMADGDVMSLWATHFRNHYCFDDDLPVIKSPEQSNADYLEFFRHYYVPRTRYDRKVIGNESTKGSDVIAFKQEGDEPRNKALASELSSEKLLVMYG